MTAEMYNLYFECDICNCAYHDFQNCAKMHVKVGKGNFAYIFSCHNILVLYIFHHAILLFLFPLSLYNTVKKSCQIVYSKPPFSIMLSCLVSVFHHVMLFWSLCFHHVIPFWCFIFCSTKLLYRSLFFICHIMLVIFVRQYHFMYKCLFPPCHKLFAMPYCYNVYKIKHFIDVYIVILFWESHIIFYHMFLCLWSEILLFHKLIYDIAPGSFLIGWDVAVRLWRHR